MAITQNFIKGLDHAEWRPKSPNISLSLSNATTANNDVVSWNISDLRGRDYADPYIYQSQPGSIPMFKKYNTITDGWVPVGSTYTAGSIPGGTHSTGDVVLITPSLGPSGTISTGATTTSVVLSTALPGAVRAGQLANRGDGKGYIIRIIGNSGGGSGLIEERHIIQNTSGTTPTITVDQAFSFTPANGDRYELLSGRLYKLSTSASKEFKYYDIATHSWSSSLSVTNLPATVPSNYNDIITLDEAYVPHDHFPGEGFIVGASTYDVAGSFSKRCLLATATSGTSITGQAAAGDAALTANKYRNFQIRIVEDTTTPTAVGQRRQITSHTAGPSVVYTVPTWTVTPSSTAKFVIENNSDWLIGWMYGQTNTYTYSISGNSWSTATIAAKTASVNVGGFSVQPFGLATSLTDQVPHSYIFCLRSSTTYDILDISNGASGTWTLNNTFYVNLNNLVASNGGASYAYVPWINDGRYIYFGSTAPSASYQPYYRLDVYSSSIEPFANLKYPNSSAAIGGNKLAAHAQYTQGTYLPFLYTNRIASTTTEFFDCFIPETYS